MSKTDPLIFFPQTCSSHGLTLPSQFMATSFFVGPGPSPWSHTWLPFLPHILSNRPMNPLSFAFKIYLGFDRFPLTPTSWSAQHLSPGVWQWPHKGCVSFFLLKFLLVRSLIMAANMTLLTYYSRSWPLLCSQSSKRLPTSLSGKIKVRTMVCRALYDLTPSFSDFISFYTFPHSFISDTLYL